MSGTDNPWENARLTGVTCHCPSAGASAGGCGTVFPWGGWHDQGECSPGYSRNNTSAGGPQQGGSCFAHSDDCTDFCQGTGPTGGPYIAGVAAHTYNGDPSAYITFPTQASYEAYGQLGENYPDVISAIKNACNATNVVPVPPSAHTKNYTAGPVVPAACC